MLSDMRIDNKWLLIGGAAALVLLGLFSAYYYFSFGTSDGISVDTGAGVKFFPGYDGRFRVPWFSGPRPGMSQQRRDAMPDEDMLRAMAMQQQQSQMQDQMPTGYGA